jgi:hypothetical protein
LSRLSVAEPELSKATLMEGMRFDSAKPMKAVRTVASKGAIPMFRSPLVHRLAVTIALFVGAAIAGGWKWNGLPH